MGDLVVWCCNGWSGLPWGLLGLDVEDGDGVKGGAAVRERRIRLRVRVND